MENKIKSECCNAPIFQVTDYGTMEGQLGIHKLRFCDKCKIIFDGEGKGEKFVPKNERNKTK